MEKYFSPLHSVRRLFLNNEDYAVYQKDMREYRILNQIPLQGIELRRKFYSAVSFGVKLFRLANGHTLEIVNDQRVSTNRPVIYSVTHIGKFDIERVFEACKTSCWIFNGDPETVYRNFDGFAMRLSGVILIDTDSKTDRYVATETAIKLLKSGGNLMLFPEGIWNVEPSLPVLPLYPGIAKIALESNADIIPVAIEQYGKHFQVNFGKNISLDEFHIGDDNAERRELYSAILQRLRDDMATLKWEIFEKNHEKRSNIGDVDMVQSQRIHDKLYEWTDKNHKPYFNEKILEDRRNLSQNEKSSKEAFQHLSSIEYLPSKNNAFLLNKRHSG